MTTPTPELIELCGAVRDELATPEQIARLEQLISADAEARKFYTRFMQMSALLERYEQAPEEEQPELVDAVPRSRGGWMALAASVAVLGSLYFMMRPSPPPVAPLVVERKEALPVAALVTADAATVTRADGTQSPANAGLELRAGDVLATAAGGSATIQPRDEATSFVLSGETRASIEHSGAMKTVQLASGSVLCDVAKQADGASWRVLTEDGEVNIVGTQLTVTTAPGGTRVAVTKGLVRVTNRQSRKTVDAAAGFVAQLSAGAVTVSAAPASAPAAKPAVEPPAVPAEAADGRNLLRNGSFEGAMLYWHNVETTDYELVRGDAPIGELAIKLKSSFLMSAPFVAKRGEHYTISLFVKGEKPGSVSVSMPPSAREVGQKANRLWTKGAGQSAKITTEWQRVSFSWPADVPPDGFWPQPHYMVQIGSSDKTNTIFVDGVTVVQGKEGTPAYVPRRDVEVIAECTNLPGWAGAVGNAFDRGATAQMAAHVANPGTQPREVTVRWQLMDYEGETAVAAAIDKKVTVPAGKTFTSTTAIPLTRNGTVLARLSVLDTGGAVIDKSDLPVTTMPYPKSATKPDYRERFGGSFAGGIGVIQKMQRIGFGWTRWQPHANGADHLPKKPADLNDSKTWEWQWADAALDRNEAHGISSHITLYPPPLWIMEKAHGGHPLPTDMRWAANDPRWDDLSVETVWDKFVIGAAQRYAARSVVFEIENEPELDHWIDHKLGAEYAKFTIRTAKLLRKHAPKRQIMVDNVYSVPSPINSYFFKAGGLAHIDVMSWHDYHAGWLTDATGIKRMKQAMNEAGGKHVELWFNEGWAFTNTAVDEPIACTSLTSAQSTNAHAASVAEMTVAGQEKTVLFHLAYETHGHSFWDYSGPGQMLWDWYRNPMPLVPMWNVLSHHIGISDEVGFVRPPGANFTIFQDLRNGRGVMIAYADRDSKADAIVEMPDFGAPLTAEDIMGNAERAGKTLTLSKTGRPVVLYTAAKTAGAVFLSKLTPLDRKNASFVSNAPGAAAIFNLPATWEGAEKGSASGNPISANGQPIWRLARLYPQDAAMTANYSPMVWGGTSWIAPDHSQGGHPSAKIESGTVSFGALGPWGGEGNNYPKVPALGFIAPKSGIYKVNGSAKSKPWDGKRTIPLSLRKNDTQRAAELKTIPLPSDGKPVPFELEVELTAGHELLFVPMMHGLDNNASNISIEGLSISEK